MKTTNHSLREIIFAKLRHLIVPILVALTMDAMLAAQCFGAPLVSTTTPTLDPQPTKLPSVSNGGKTKPHTDTIREDVWFA